LSTVWKTDNIMFCLTYLNEGQLSYFVNKICCFVILATCRMDNDGGCMKIFFSFIFHILLLISWTLKFIVNYAKAEYFHN